ncbi:MAG: FliH/SctL family protein [Bryobacteraceae bacterium]
MRDEKVEVQPVDWQPLPGTSAVVASHAASFPHAGARTAGNHPVESGEESLKARVHELERQVEKSAQEAFQKGLRQGEAEGRKQALAQLDGEMQRLGRAVAEMAGLRHAIRREAEEELVRLALTIARRILHRELTVDPEALTGLVKAALGKIEMRDTYRVRTHPEHVAAVTRSLAQIGAPQKIEVVADTSLEKGSAIFETGRGSLDASVETQLVEIQRGLVDLMETSS